jgi:protein SCO1/2
VAATATEDKLPRLAQVPAYEFVNQDGTALRSADLKGKPYVLDFMFTSCGGICPVMSRSLGVVREGLGKDTTVRIVSVTVDPDKDKPAVLKRYAREFVSGAGARWDHVTGDKSSIMALLTALHLATERDVQNFDPSRHSTRYMLVDGDGWVRGYYTYDDADARDQLVRDARKLETGKQS